VPYGSALLEFPEMLSHLRSTLLLAFLAAVGCGGQTEDDGDVVIDDNESALSGVENASADDERADDGCRDGDREGHHRHRRHWFKILDRIDGTKDKAITIAALPPGLPDRLIAKLHRIDKNDDGIVTKKEAKRWRKHRHHRDGHGEHEDGEHDDGEHENESESAEGQ